MLAGRFYDGRTAEVSAAIARRQGTPDGGTWVFTEAETGIELARWPAADIVSKPGRHTRLLVSATGAPPGARFILEEPGLIAEAKAEMPALARQRRIERLNQIALLCISTILLAGVVAAYIWGIPLAAGPITAALPLDWEAELGSSVAVQIEQSLGGDTRMTECDPDPNSTANIAIARFVNRVLGDQTPPFPIKVVVGRSVIPNAFAIPGGQVYYLSSLLEETKTGDEFAGVLAHEMGHAMNRHAMQSVVTAAGTGLLIGFILGDMTGLSVAGGLGAAIIDSRHTREAERDADVFAADAANRLGFDPTALADLLDRVAKDDSGAAVFALLSSHPLTAERRQTLKALAAGATTSATAFTPAEWQAIKTMCDPRNVRGGLGIDRGRGSNSR